MFGTAGLLALIMPFVALVGLCGFFGFFLAFATTVRRRKAEPPIPGSLLGDWAKWTLKLAVFPVAFSALFFLWLFLTAPRLPAF